MRAAAGCDPLPPFLITDTPMAQADAKYYPKYYSRNVYESEVYILSRILHSFPGKF